MRLTTPSLFVRKLYVGQKNIVRVLNFESGGHINPLFTCFSYGSFYSHVWLTMIVRWCPMLVARFNGLHLRTFRMHKPYMTINSFCLGGCAFKAMTIICITCSWCQLRDVLAMKPFFKIVECKTKSIINNF